MAFTNRSPIIMQGKVFIQERQFNGPPLTGLEWVGNADNASLSFKQKRERIVDNFTGRGLTIAAPVVETEIEFMLSMLEISQQSFARGSLGRWGGVEAAGTASEAVVMYNDSYIQLAKTGVSGVSIAGATLGTDYVIEAGGNGGLLRVLPGSAIAPAGTPHPTTVSYSYAANNGQVEGFVTGQKFYTVVVNGINVAQGGQPHVLRIHQIQLDALKKADFIDKKQMKLESGGEMLIDSSIDDNGDDSQVFWLRKA